VRHLVWVRILIVLHKTLCVLIDRVIGQMHEEIVDVVRIWALIKRGCKSNQTLLINENSKRVDSHEEHVDSEIEFQTIN
jgi:hypothetical protein